MNFTNAVLVEIAGPGPIQANGDPGVPVTVWTGRVAGYLKRTRRQVVSGGQSVNVHRDTFTLLRSQGAPVVEETGGDWEASTVIVEDNRTPEVKRRRFTVRGMENRAAGTAVDSIRLELDSEAAA